MNTYTWRGSSGYIEANCGQLGTQACRSALRLRCMFFTASALFYAELPMLAFKTPTGMSNEAWTCRPCLLTG